MNTRDNSQPAVRPPVPTQASPTPLTAIDAFALWRLRGHTLYFRPEAWQCVERLKAACAAELLAHRSSTTRAIACFEALVAAAPANDVARRPPNRRDARRPEPPLPGTGP